jgi:putative acetyltransferase
MNVRGYQPEDAASLARLFTESVRSTNAKDYSPEQIAAWAPEPPDIEQWPRRLDSLIVFLAQHGSEIVGFVTFEPDGHLDHLYVHSRFQRRGVASALYRRVEQEELARGVHCIFTEASIAARPCL